MQLYSFVVQLRIWHPRIDPAVITETLGFTPDVQSKAGERRRTRAGTLLDGVWRESHWNGDLFNYGWTMSSDRDLEDVLTEAARALMPHREFLITLREEGGRLVLQASSHSSRNYAFELPPQLMNDLSSLGISFAHDVYPCQQSY